MPEILPHACAVSVIEASVKKDMSFNPIKIMRHAIEEANEKIHELAKADAGKAGMGTTLVAVTVVGYYAYVANVGDSRLYISGEQGLVQITRDHSWIAEMVMRGELSKEEARNHPDKNIITRALGERPKRWISISSMYSWRKRIGFCCVQTD